MNATKPLATAPPRVAMPADNKPALQVTLNDGTRTKLLFGPGEVDARGAVTLDYEPSVFPHLQAAVGRALEMTSRGDRTLVVTPSSQDAGRFALWNLVERPGGTWQNLAARGGIADVTYLSDAVRAVVDGSRAIIRD